ncbi:hypothetical protein KKB40_00900 [Patescibacteria group bacterium]|nr:hypothetical protein [Patescibacteria group bacterium]
MIGINMNQKIVVTNLRIPEDEWLQVKVMAAELGISANEYVSRMIKISSVKRQLVQESKSKDSPYFPLCELINKPYKRKPMSMSKEDKAIYDL